MQMMRFFLCTGFGKSSESYGSSEEDRTLSLGQGNAAAGAGYAAVSSLNINAYLLYVCPQFTIGSLEIIIFASLLLRLLMGGSKK
jgi:hypothetical protein